MYLWVEIHISLKSLSAVWISTDLYNQSIYYLKDIPNVIKQESIVFHNAGMMIERSQIR